MAVELKNGTTLKISRNLVPGISKRNAESSKHLDRPLNRVKLLVSIVSRDEDERLYAILNEFSASLNLEFEGVGTAKDAVLDYLGIGETEKSVLFSLIPECDEDVILREIRVQMSLHMAGKGISFTVPLSGISEIVANGLMSAAHEKTTRGNVMKSEDRKYELIIAAMAADHVDEAMEAARSAGAAGGTVIRARSTNNEKAEQFVGISLMPEQEILLILAKKEGKIAIMNALSEKIGLKTEAGGVIFSVPVDKTAGIAMDEVAEKSDD